MHKKSFLSILFDFLVLRDAFRRLYTFFARISMIQVFFRDRKKYKFILTHKRSFCSHKVSRLSSHHICFHELKITFSFGNIIFSTFSPENGNEKNLMHHLYQHFAKRHFMFITFLLLTGFFQKKKKKKWKNVPFWVDFFLLYFSLTMKL